MKKNYLLLIFALAAMSSTYAQITPEQVKKAVKEAKQELDAEAREAARQRPAPLVPKIKPDTITDPQLFKFVNAQIIKAEVANYYYVVSLYASKNLKSIDSIQEDVDNLNLKIEQNKTKNISTATAEAKVVELNNLKTKIETFNSTIDDDDPKKNFRIYYAPADPEFPVLMSNTIIWPPAFSVMTIPVKIRPRVRDIPSSSKTDIDNIGLFASLAWTRERLHFDNEKTTLKVGVGGFIAPMVETLKPDNAPGLKVAETSQFYLSTGAAITVTYKKITLAFIPAGFDIGFSDTAKLWRYDGRYWYGFGIGVDTELFGF